MTNFKFTKIKNQYWISFIISGHKKSILNGSPYSELPTKLIKKIKKELKKYPSSKLNTFPGSHSILFDKRFRLQHAFIEFSDPNDEKTFESLLNLHGGLLTL